MLPIAIVPRCVNIDDQESALHPGSVHGQYDNANQDDVSWGEGNSP